MYWFHSSLVKLRLAISQARACHDSGSISHRTIVLSRLPEARVLPSGLMATLHKAPVCPVSGRPMGRRVATSHRRMVLSWLPETRVSPLGLNATLFTAPVCSVSGGPSGRSVASHSRIVLSLLPEARVLPSGL